MNLLPANGDQCTTLHRRSATFITHPGVSAESAGGVAPLEFQASWSRTARGLGVHRRGRRHISSFAPGVHTNPQRVCTNAVRRFLDFRHEGDQIPTFAHCLARTEEFSIWGSLLFAQNAGERPRLPEARQSIVPVQTLF